MKKNLSTVMAAAMAFGTVVPAFAAEVSATADVALSQGEITVQVAYDRVYETKFTPGQSDDVLREGVTILDVISKDASDYLNNKYLVSIKVNKDNFKALKAEFTSEFTNYVDYAAFESAVKSNKSDYDQAQADIANYLNHTFTDVNGVRKAKYKKVETERQAESITGNAYNELEVKLVNQQTTGSDITFIFKNVKVEEASTSVTPDELDMAVAANYKALSQKVFELENKKNVTVKVKETNATTLDIEVYKNDASKKHISTLRLNNFNQFNKYDFVRISGANSDFANHWAKTNIFNAMYADKIDNAVNFRPDASITRAEFAKMLYNSFESTLKLTNADQYKDQFSDVNEKDWFYDYVLALDIKGIVEGDGKGTFRPDDKISRQEAAKMVAAVAKLAGKADITGESFNGGKHVDVQTSFRDDKKIQAWADESVQQLNAKGVITGYPGDNTFRPENGITRAESIVMMERAAALR